MTFPVTDTLLRRALGAGALFLALPAPAQAAPLQEETAAEEEKVQELEAAQEELERKIDILGRELERLRLGKVQPPAPPIGERYYGLGPAASKIYTIDQGLSIGGYGEVLYQNFEGGSQSDDFDFLRAILYFGYRFNEKWLLNTEIEIEHADEIFLEFATLDYLHRPELNVRAGLVLIPMGFLNELHEPNTFYSARRPDVESFIIPSTWRENGVGVFGDVGDWSYRAYVVNGFDGSGFRGSNGLRGGRQKGSQTDSDDFAGVARLDWSGVAGVLAGGSYYYGHSGQDSGVDGDVSLWELHTEVNYGGLRFRGLYAAARVDDVLGLAQDGGLVDNMGMLAMGVTGNEAIGDELEGGYLELGYDVLTHFNSDQNLIPFVRFETYDLQQGVPAPFAADGSRDVRVTTFGVAYLPVPNLIFKVDFQDYRNDAGTGIDQLNVAAGYVF